MKSKYTKGSAVFHIKNISVTTTLNNSREDATTVTLDSVTDVFFDDNNMFKWYTFTLASDTTVFLSAIADGYHGTFMDLYDGSEQLIRSADVEYAHLEAGTYHIKLRNYPNTIASLKVEEVIATEGPTDTLSPQTVALNQHYDYLLIENSNHYYQIVVTEGTLFDITVDCINKVDYNIYNSHELSEYSGSLYSDDSTYVYLEPGTYTLVLEGDSASSQLYRLTFYNKAELLDNYSYSNIDPPEMDPHNLNFYAIEADTPFYQTFTINEKSLYYGYYDDLDILSIYQNDELILTRIYDDEDIFPIILEPGTYIMEFITHQKGYFFVEEIYIDPVTDNGGTIAAPTEMDYPVTIDGYNSGDSLIEVYEFIVSESGFFDIEDNSEEDVLYYILDDDDNVVFYFDTDNYFTYLEAGTYTLIICPNLVTYSIEIYSIDHEASGTDFASAKEIFVNMSTTVILDKYNDNYLTFTVDKESYLDLYLYVRSSYEIYDSNYEPYGSSVFIAGQYYIRLETIDNSNVTIPYMKSTFKLTDITGIIYNNTMLTAETTYSNKTVDGFIIDPLAEAWFKIDLPYNGVFKGVHWANDGEFYLYDSLGVLIQADYDYYQFLDAGVYYIMVQGSYGEYDFSYSTDAYEDYSNTEVGSHEIVINPHTYHYSYREETSDEDYYVFTLTEETLIFSTYYSFKIELQDSSNNVMNANIKYTYILYNK